MRFPLSLTMSMATYMLRKKLGGSRKGGTAKYPLVLMLEPLHACNLKCSGCGRIREYADTLGQRLSVDQCLHAVKECDAPIVSICGGEPLLYPEIVELTDKILGLGKHIYLCTNGTLLEEKLDDFVQLAKKNRRVKNRLYWNVHLDGTAAVHDAIACQPGTFERAYQGIFAAKRADFYVYTNTTLYKTSSVDDLVTLAEMLSVNFATFARLPSYRIDGMMIAPGYGYDAVLNNSPPVEGGHFVQQNGGVVSLPDSEPPLPLQEGGIDHPCPSKGEKLTTPAPPKEGNCHFFLTRPEIHELFREVRQKMKRFRITATPIYMDFLCGERELPCAAWANPTYNVKGWKAPCYLMTDRHYDTFAEFMQETDWSKIGRNNDGLGNDSRCQDCMMHCGYEPAAVLFGNRLRDLVRLALWQMKVL